MIVIQDLFLNKCKVCIFGRNLEFYSKMRIELGLDQNSIKGFKLKLEHVGVNEKSLAYLSSCLHGHKS